MAEGFGRPPQNLEVVAARFWLSRLAEGRARRTATRWLALFALAGFALTLLFLVATGRGSGRWFFVLSIWLGLVFLPLWLVTQAFQSIGPSLRRGLMAGLAGRADRYRHPTTVTVVVEDLFERAVVMPRIATPEQAQKAREAASALVLRAGRSAGGLATALSNCLATVEEWTRALSRWAASDAAGNIQARWAEVRALAALTALTQTLLAVSEDQAGQEAPLLPPGADPDRVRLHAFLDAVLNYCDDLALQVEVLPWTEPSLGLAGPPPGAVETLRGAWQRYVETAPPAPSALDAFMRLTLPG